jgi:Protein of unknown function (DUF1566)
MARSEAGWLVGAIAVAASLVACSDLLGLGDYDVCGDECDAGDASADVGETGMIANLDGGLDVLSIDAALDVTVPLDAAPLDAMTFEAGEAGAIDAALYWAHWPMPNPSEIADAQGLPNSSVYTLDDAGVVFDGVTHLRWQTGYASNIGSFDSAMSYCASTFGPGWRVPTRIELVSIIDYTQQSPAIDPTFVVNDAGALIGGRFWTASGTWAVDFADGVVTTLPALLVRCVSVGP